MVDIYSTIFIPDYSSLLFSFWFLYSTSDSYWLKVSRKNYQYWTSSACHIHCLHTQKTELSLIHYPGRRPKLNVKVGCIIDTTTLLLCSRFPPNKKYNLKNELPSVHNQLLLFLECDNRKIFLSFWATTSPLILLSSSLCWSRNMPLSTVLCQVEERHVCFEMSVSRVKNSCLPVGSEGRLFIHRYIRRYNYI